ncbi:hypothetical protein NDU88_003111 [Pleurodeles waltl]|uniref:Uncharacterized protein n=1 Tax=Pleurodeles waltl TaxID=8319 RepID=A0AAV7KUM2_PLEWA|nr:hypothetical protein NDU88_003110 [Pleurodeles waltl]KAJ1082950.1 hypothetical protein NDU88_003111 [Pleurodeles waltl]
MANCAPLEVYRKVLTWFRPAIGRCAYPGSRSRMSKGDAIPVGRKEEARTGSRPARALLSNVCEPQRPPQRSCNVKRLIAIGLFLPNAIAIFECLE